MERSPKFVLLQTSGSFDGESRKMHAAESARQSRHPSGMPRKVRAPQGTVPGNAWAARADGKCNRKIPPKRAGFASRDGKGEMVR